ncbi:MAG: SRPBCC family protein [Gammaproteobacteria bacterium]|nr:SRPBCC family protein [Gammaproteobacteria bacterium]
MKAIRILTLILGVSAISLLLIALVLPDHARIERSVVINASPAQVFPHVNGMRAFHDWSPWAKIDPNTQYRFAGPEQGVGSRMDWSSDHVQVGGGTQEIVSSRADAYVETRLDFGAQGNGVASFSLTPEGPDGRATRVVWDFRTEFGWDLFGRWFGLLLDRFLGPSYEQGLATLKQQVER